MDWLNSCKNLFLQAVGMDVRAHRFDRSSRSTSVSLFHFMAVLSGMAVISFCANAQSVEVDSLLSELRRSRHAAERIQIFNGLGRAYLEIDPDSTEYYANQALTLARSLNNVSGQAHAYRLLGLVQELKGDYDRARGHTIMAMSLCRAAGDELGMAKAQTNLGVIAYREGKVEDALSFFSRSHHTYEKLGLRRESGEALVNLGLTEMVKGNYPTGLTHLLDALRLFESSGDEPNVAAVYNNLGMVYGKIGDDDKALEYHAKAAELSLRHGNVRSAGNAYSNMGACYFEKRDFANALNSHLRAMQLKETVGDSVSLSVIYSSLGQVYDSLGNRADAHEFYERARQLMERSGNHVNAPYIYGNLGRHYLQLMDFDKAGDLLTRALNSARELGNESRVSDSHRDLALYFEMKGDFAKSLAHYKEYAAMRDSLFIAQRTRDIAEIQTKYETAKKDQEIVNLNRETARQRTIRNVVIIAVSTLGILIFLLIRSSHKRRKAALERQVTEVEMKALRSQMNPHFIFNSLNSIVQFIRRNDLRIAEDYLHRFSRLMRLTLENSRESEVPLSSDIHALKLYMDLEALRLDHKFDYSIDMDDRLNPDSTYIPPMMLQPFVENSIWHGISHLDGHGHIDIRIRREGELLECQVEDNGVGRKFHAGKQREAVSLALDITRERLELINHQHGSNASMVIEDMEQGVRVSVSLPFYTE